VDRLPARGPPGRGLLALPIDLSEGLAFNAVLAIASILGIALPALLVTAATSGKAGVRDLLSRCLRWRVGVVWYLAALFGLLAGHGACRERPLIPDTARGAHREVVR
jgi:hypothetical protein